MGDLNDLIDRMRYSGKVTDDDADLVESLIKERDEAAAYAAMQRGGSSNQNARVVSQLKTEGCDALRAAGYVALPRWWVTRQDYELIQYMAFAHKDDVYRIKKDGKTDN